LVPISFAGKLKLARQEWLSLPETRFVRTGGTSRESPVAASARCPLDLGSAKLLVEPGSLRERSVW
jgi:hypothetical protein